MSEGTDQDRRISTERAGEIEVVPREPSPGGGAEEVEELERTADALRDDLGRLVDELGRRGKRVLVPAALGAALLAALGVGGLVLARRRARRQLVSRPRALMTAVGKTLSTRLGFEKKQPAQPRPLVRIGAAAGAAAASVVARWAARQLLERVRNPTNVQAAPQSLLNAPGR